MALTFPKWVKYKQASGVMLRKYNSSISLVRDCHPYDPNSNWIDRQMDAMLSRMKKFVEENIDEDVVKFATSSWTRKTWYFLDDEAAQAAMDHLDGLYSDFEKLLAAHIESKPPRGKHSQPEVTDFSKWVSGEVRYLSKEKTQASINDTQIVYAKAPYFGKYNFAITYPFTVDDLKTSIRHIFGEALEQTFFYGVVNWEGRIETADGATRLIAGSNINVYSNDESVLMMLRLLISSKVALRKIEIV